MAAFARALSVRVCKLNTPEILEDLWSAPKYWWRRGELNPCPKIVNAPDLHV